MTYRFDLWYMTVLSVSLFRWLVRLFDLGAFDLKCVVETGLGSNLRTILCRAADIQNCALQDISSQQRSVLDKR